MKKWIYVPIVILFFTSVILGVMLYHSIQEQKQLQNHIVSNFSHSVYFLIHDTEDVLEGVVNWDRRKYVIFECLVKLDVLAQLGSDMNTGYFRKMTYGIEDGPQQFGRFLDDWKQLYDELQRNERMNRDDFNEIIKRFDKLEEKLVGR